MNASDLTASMQDALKAIHALKDEDRSVSTSALAARLNVSAPSGTAMLKRLSALGLVRYERYRGVWLTPTGERVAIEVIRHHRLLEQYLAETLGVGIDAVHEEADRLEHALSEELEARIDEQLGYPTHDPHGDPIPDAALNLARPELRALGDLEPGEQATVRRVPDGDGQLLRYLSSLKLLPGQAVELLSAAPFGGPLVVLAAGVEQVLSRELAAVIGVA